MSSVLALFVRIPRASMLPEQRDRAILILKSAFSVTSDPQGGWALGDLAKGLVSDRVVRAARHLFAPLNLWLVKLDNGRRTPLL